MKKISASWDVINLSLNKNASKILLISSALGLLSIMLMAIFLSLGLK